MTTAQDDLSFKQALQIAAQMVEIPYDDMMHTSLHSDIIRRLFNLATEIQQQYDNKCLESKIPELK